MRRFLVSVCFCITTAMCALAQADITSYEFAEPEMAQRFVGLTTVLRCPKCQKPKLIRLGLYYC